MKSIMQEDSSIAKAIEKAWIRAEKPQYFSIKILEEPERNFFGMTVKSAKIALFFDAVEPKKTAYPREKRESKPASYKQQRETFSSQEKKQKPSPQKEEIAVEKKSPDQPASRTPRSRWSTALVQDAEKWIRDVLSHMGKSDSSFSTKMKNNNLIFIFENPILENADQERLLFSSFAHLLSQSLKNKFKNEARGLKIILQSS